MTKRRKKWVPKFLKSLASSGNVSTAAKAAGITRQAAYKQYATDADFAAAWEEAIDEAADMLEAVAYERAKEGGSDRLLIFLLQAARPHKYRPGATIPPPINRPSAIAPNTSSLTADDIMITCADGQDRSIPEYEKYADA